MTRKPAPDADSLSCALAARFAGEWARSVVRRAEEAGGSAPPWFVDGFAGADLQRAALRGVAAKAAALDAIRALDDVLPGSARIVLVEEDPGLLARLCDELADADAADRIRVASDPATAEPGEILVIEAQFASVAASLARAIGDEPALVRLAPLAARTLPWTALEPLAGLAGTDVLLRVPLEDFARQARFVTPLADLPPHIRRVVEGCSALLGDARHAWLPAWREVQRTSPDAANATVLDRMQALLAGAADARTLHPLRLDGDGGPVHLILSTPHPEHAEALDAAPSARAAAPAAEKPESAPAEAAPKPRRGSKRKASASADPSDIAPPVDAAPAEAAPSVDVAPAEPALPVDAAAPTEAVPSEDDGVPSEAAPLVDAAAPPESVPSEDDGVPSEAAPPVDNALSAAEAVGADSAPEPTPSADAESAPPAEPAAVLDLFGPDVEPKGEVQDESGRAPAEPRPAAPRAKKKREPAPDLLGLFDEPET